MKWNVFAQRLRFYTMTVEAVSAAEAEDAAARAPLDHWDGGDSEEELEVVEVSEARPDDEAHWRVTAEGELEPWLPEDQEAGN